MKLFRFTMGLIEKYGVFADATEAYDRRDTLDVQFDYLPVEIEEVKVEGYEITLTPTNDDQFTGWNKAKYREYLDENGLAYTAQWGEARLRELVTYHMNPPAAVEVPTGTNEPAAAEDTITADAPDVAAPDNTEQLNEVQ